MWAKLFPWAPNPFSSCLLVSPIIFSHSNAFNLSPPPLDTFSQPSVTCKSLQKNTTTKIENIPLQVYPEDPHMATTPPVGSFLRRVLPVPLRPSAFQLSSGIQQHSVHPSVIAFSHGVIMGGVLSSLPVAVHNSLQKSTCISQFCIPVPVTVPEA